MKHVWVILAAILLLAAPPSFAQRLPTTVVPNHYTLWFAPDLQNETFRGRETIRVRVASPTNVITLNAAEITFGPVTITSGGQAQTATVATDEKTETATLTVARPLAAGPAEIAITYTGILNDKLRGFYISKGNNRKYAVSQMEATDARRAFPSFDEPAYKATFDVTLMIDTGDMAISNGRQVSDTPGPEPGKHTVTFATSPKMSTYLVALLVGDFTCREGRSDGIPIRVCATPNQHGLTGFALEAAEQQVAFYNKFFGVKYPFGKLDIIGIPDFAAGAMENAGAITFRERLLLADPERASLNTKKNIASVTSHEIAHQWFGDLVTMKWWDDIWLNEGFATWMANKPLAEWKPEWHVELDDADETQTALGLDVLRSTRPIRTKAETPEEINELFDAIAYEKTAAVLRMLESYVGVSKMREGIASYIRKHSYGNATGEDFWTEMARVTGKPVDRIMKSFVDQPGAPVLKVESACRNGASAVTVTEGRFVGTPDASAPPPQTWTLPACFTSGSGAPRCEVIDKPAQTVQVPGCATVFANADARGYYLTEYTPAAIRAMASTVTRLAPVERLSLLGDEWWMVRSGRHDIDGYLDLAGALAADPSSQILSTVANRLNYTAQFIADPGDLPRFQAWLRARFGPTLTSLGLPGKTTDDDEAQSRRATLLALLGGTANDPAVQAQARELALKYIDDPRSLAPTLVATVLNTAAASGDAALYDRYVAQIGRLSGSPEEYYRFFNALAWFSDPALVKRTLDFTLTPAARSQDVGLLIGGMMGRPAAREAAWAFTKANWNALTEKLGTFQGIPEIVSGVGALCSTESAADVRAFFEKNPVPSSARTVQQVLEKIETCAAMDRRQSAPLSKWLAAR